MPAGSRASKFWLRSRVTSAVFVENNPGWISVSWQLCREIICNAVFLAKSPLGIDAKLVADKSLNVCLSIRSD